MSLAQLRLARLSFLIPLLAVAMLASCVSLPDGHSGYDPNARETLGVVQRRAVAAENTKQEVTWLSRTQQVGTSGPPVTLYRHTVMLEDGRIVDVLSSYPNHSITSCVKVFESTQPTYPRMTSASGCKK